MPELEINYFTVFTVFAPNVMPNLLGPTPVPHAVSNSQHLIPKK